MKVDPTGNERQRSTARLAVAMAMALALVAGVVADSRPSAAATGGGRVHVVVTAGLGGTDAAHAAVGRHGGEVAGRIDLVDGVAATVPARHLDALRAEPAVRNVSADGPVHVQADLTAAGGSEVRSVHREATGADVLHERGTTGAGVTVALIDTGVADVPDLAGRVRQVTDPITGASSSCVDLSGEGHCRDGYGHGTFMAGIILGDGASSGGRYGGMAPGAHLLSIKIAGRDGSSDVSGVLAGIQWAVANRDRHGIRVLNLSLGTDSIQSWDVDPFNYAVQRAWEAGIVVVVAASNLGPAAGTISKPGDDPWVLTVGAVDDRGTRPTADDRLPDFSARGPTAHGLTKPDVVAPGAHVVSLRAPGSEVDERFPEGIDDTYRRGSGTSMAAAVVSGGVALLLEEHPTWTPDQVKAALARSAVPTARSDANAVGAGSVDLPGASAAGTSVAGRDHRQSSGLGSLDLSRGSVEVRTTDLDGWLLGTVLDSTLTAQLVLWDPIGFTTQDWRTEALQVSPLLLHRWHATRWHGNNWQGNNWQGNNWQGAWQGSTADGEEPRPDTYGRPWDGAAWYGLWE